MADIESCWGGPHPNGSAPAHSEVRCKVHGHVMATCQPAPHGNCVNPNPRYVSEMGCVSVCPEHEWTDAELGIGPSGEDLWKDPST